MGDAVGLAVASLHQLDLPPEAYEPHLDVGFTKLARRTTAGCCSERARPSV
jgi:hypothetical protein